MKIQVEVFWVVTLFSVVGYRRFGEPCQLRHQGVMKAAWFSEKQVSCYIITRRHNPAKP